MRSFVLLAALVAASVANDSYVVVVPGKLRPGMDLNISINLLKGQSLVTASLKDSNKGTVGTASANFHQDQPGTLTIKVPPTIKSGTYILSVTGTGSTAFTNETTLQFSPKSMSIFIQTDKAMYKPGQTVHFRAFVVYPDLQMYTGSMNVEIFDPSSNKIKQWIGVQDASGVYTNYLTMSDDPIKGDWKIKVTAGSITQEKVITIAEYVLPKFEVTVELPSYALQDAANLPITVKAKYTYGKPVKGTVTLITKMDNWYRPFNFQGEQPSVTKTGTIDGEAKFSLPLTQIKAMASYLQNNKVRVTANVTEELTGITLSGSGTVTFYTTAEKLEFLPSNPDTFKPGLPYTAYVKLEQQDGLPVAGVKSPLTVETTVTWEEKAPATTPIYFYPITHTYKLPVDSFTVPEDGIVPVLIHVPDNASNINLEVKYGSTVTAYKSLSKSYSPSNSYLQLFLRSSQIKAGQVINFEVQATQPVSNLVYQVLSRGSIVSAGHVSGNSQKSFHFTLSVTARMAPNARIVVYFVLQDGEIVTDSISFDVEGVFRNDVGITMDKQEAQPGDKVNVQVTADPQSLVNLLAVDQSVLLLKSGNDITQADVIGELKTYDTITPNYGFGGFGGRGIIPLDAVARRKRMAIWWPYPIYYGGSDANQIFQNAGVTVLTDAFIYHHVQRMLGCPFCRFPMPMASMGAAGGGAMPPNAGFGGVATGSLQEVKHIRQEFPETWLWTNTTTSADGRAVISTTVPDTITSWVATAIAVNPTSGLGVAPTAAKIRVFRPFFVSLNLPYSVVRGEQLALQAIVFNYLDKDVTAVVSLAQSKNFRNIVVDASGVQSFVSQDQTATVTIRAGEAQSVFFPIIPSGLGPIDIVVSARTPLAADAVKRTVQVEAEGLAKEYNIPVLVDLKDTNTFTKTVTISLPSSTVAGSQRCSISAIGDLMGPSVNGLDKLLQMPTGCGEQNMLGFAPDVFVTNYLKATNQLTSDIEEKAISFMEKGYQRELTYQHKDASFSAFGDQDPSGSMWLTAFVVKSFHQAKAHVFIDEEVIARAIDWMLSKQNSDGSFPEPGRVIHTDMQGGSASGTSLTAFVLISLLENSQLTGGIQQRITAAKAKSQTYLESKLPTLTEDYVLAITTYALTLAGSDHATSALAMLNAKATVKDGTKFWHSADSKPVTTHTYWQPPNEGKARDVEMTSYALLTYAHKGDFNGGLPIMKYVVSQRNPSGGFISTQDTVLALQALSEYAKMAYANKFDIQATVSAGTERHSFAISQANALVLQTVDLSAIPTSVTVHATGHGIALVQVSVFFHVEVEVQQPAFELTVTLLEETLNSLTVQTCTKYLQAGKSGMAVQEIGVPSGFEVDSESISKLAILKRIESANKKIILYFDEIGSSQVCVSLRAQRTGLVAKSQPAPVRVYDYYAPDRQVTAFYQSQVLKDADINSICKDC